MKTDAVTKCLICVDDEVIVLQSLKQELRMDPFFSGYRIVTSGSPEKVTGMVRELLSEGYGIPVVISDQRMPLMAGDRLLSELHELVPDTRKILLTGFSDLEAVVGLVNQGALTRFLSKPWNRQDLLMTVRDACAAWEQEKQILQLRQQIESMTYAMVASLENANHFFDEDTGLHLRRISRLSGMIAEKGGLPEEFRRKVEIFSPLHDIGKVGVPREILFKPDKLTPEEFEAVKQHARIGYEIINNGAIDGVARNIVLYHHEKWNGKGYPEGLAGSAIPVEARVVSIADVFDALVNERIYKPAFSLEKTRAIMAAENGISFDPAYLEPFLAELDRVSSVEELYG